MPWISVTLNISGEQRKVLKELGLLFAGEMESRGRADKKILEPLKEELSYIINANSEVKAIVKDALATGNHYALRLIDSDSEILNLPWSMAEESETDTPLGSIESLHILKTPAAVIDKNLSDFTPHIEAPLKILIMISSPLDLDYKSRLSYEQEEYDILKAFEPLLKTGHVEIDYTDDGSLEALKSKIKTNKYHILHFSGHGTFHEGRGYLLLEDHYNLKKKLVDEDEFAKVINSNPNYKIPLVVLSSCQTAQGGSERILRGITGKL
ncbi:MAG: CHAT domain-containing protein, partial [Nitrospirae bacterium YQR-1]